MRIPPLIGTFTVEDGDLDAPFWDGLARSELRLQRCAGCGTWTWGPQWRCGSCGSWDVVWEAVTARGQVFSWTRTWHAPAPELAGDLPYTVVLGDGRWHRGVSGARHLGGRRRPRPGRRC